MFEGQLDLEIEVSLLKGVGMECEERLRFNSPSVDHGVAIEPIGDLEGVFKQLV